MENESWRILAWAFLFTAMLRESGFSNTLTCLIALAIALTMPLPVCVFSLIVIVAYRIIFKVRY